MLRKGGFEERKGGFASGDRRDYPRKRDCREPRKATESPERKGITEKTAVNYGEKLF